MNTVLVWFEALIRASEMDNDQKHIKFVQQSSENHHGVYEYSLVKYFLEGIYRLHVQFTKPRIFKQSAFIVLKSDRVLYC